MILNGLKLRMVIDGIKENVRSAAVKAQGIHILIQLNLNLMIMVEWLKRMAQQYYMLKKAY